MHYAQGGLFSFMDKEQKDKRRREIEISDMNAILDMPQGRRFIRRILEHARTFQTPFASSGGTREWTDFNCGMQNVGLWLFSEIEAAKPDAMLIIKREHNSREKMDEMDLKEEIENKTVLTRP